MSGASIKIPAELFALAESSHFEGCLELDILNIGPDEYHFSEPISWEVEVTNTGAALLVVGFARGEASVACSRCLEETARVFEGAIEGYFLIEGHDSSEYEDDEDEIGDDEFDVLPADHIIDLESLITAALMIDAPNMPLCRDDCAGLCPNCGANLNEGECGCSGDSDLEEFNRAANPFAALAGLTFDE